MENVKQTNGQVSVETNKKAEPPQYLKEYDGIGTYNKYGVVDYLISLPKCAKDLINIKKVKTFKMTPDSTTVFVLINAGKDLHTNENHEVVKMNFHITGFDTKKIESTMNLVLFHDEVEDINDADALEVIRDCKLLVPEGCGNGVLTFY